MSGLRAQRTRRARGAGTRTPANAVRLVTVALTPGTPHQLPLDATPPPGMSEAIFDHARLHIEVLAETLRLPTASPNATKGALALRLTPPPKGQARLARVEIDGLTLGASGFALRLGEACFLPGQDAPQWNAPPQPQEAALRLLLRPARGSGFAPPIAAAPAFPMPGKGAALYGTALGGAALALRRGPGDRLDLTLTPSPALPGVAAELLLGAVPPGEDRLQLPNEVASQPWRALELRAVWEVEAAGITVTLGSAPVATLEQPPTPGTVLDFAPALRAALKQAIAAGAAVPALTVASPVATSVRLGVSLAGLHWLAHAPDATLRLTGNEVAHDLPMPAPPTRLDAVVSGNFGPARLIGMADSTPAASRAGMVLGPGVQAARRLDLNEAERALPICRAALFGRSAAACEITLALHAGTPGVIGAPLGPPVALVLTGDAAPAWHLAEWAAPFLLPPHGGSVWLVARAGRGAFLWHGAADSQEAMLSRDAAATWQRLAHAPLAQLAVHDPDGPPGALALRLNGVVAVPDIAGGQMRFRHDFAAPTAALRGADGALTLGFAAARDATLTLGEIDLTIPAGA